MIFSGIFNYGASKYSNPDDNGNFIEIDRDLKKIVDCLQGRVRFGAGTTGNDGENISGQWLTIVTNGTGNTESTFTHSIGSIPIGYIVIWQDKSASIYQGPTTGTVWTSTTISLKASVATVTAKLFLLK